MSSPPVRYTLKRSRAGKHIDELKLPTCEIRDIKNDVEFSDLFEQLLEKRSNCIKNKLSRNLEKDKDTKVESASENLVLKNPEPKLILTENKISEYLKIFKKRKIILFLKKRVILISNKSFLKIYHLFASVGHSLAEQRFANFEEVEKWLVEWFALKEKKFFWNGIHDLLE